MAITSVNDIVSGLGSQQHINIYKSFGTPKAAGTFQSGWLAAGYPGSGSTSGSYGSGTNFTCGSTAAGAMRYTNSGSQNWLAESTFMSSQVGTLIIADRLWSCAGMGFAAGQYVVPSGWSLPSRITDGGVGCELWVENFVATGAASGSLVAQYNNTTGGSSTGVLAAVQSAAAIGQMQPVPLQTGDLGISMLKSVGIGATWTSGSFGMTILKRITELEITTANVGKTMDWAMLGIPPIPNDACVMFMWMATAASTFALLGSVTIIDK